MLKTVKRTFWKIVITACVVLSISGIFGKIPFFSVISGSDDEVMYIANYDKCRCIPGPSGSQCEVSSVMFKIEVGNTGKNSVQSLEIYFENVPYPIDQVYYSVQNLSIVDQRTCDPTVEIVCANDTPVECRKIVPIPSFPHRCAFFTTEYSVPRSHRIEFDPCYQIGSAIPQELSLKISDFSSGSLIRFGFLSYYTDEDTFDWKALGQITIDFKGNTKIVAGDPQGTVLGRFLHSIVDLF